MGGKESKDRKEKEIEADKSYMIGAIMEKQICKGNHYLKAPAENQMELRSKGYTMAGFVYSFWIK